MVYQNYGFFKPNKEPVNPKTDLQEIKTRFIEQLNTLLNDDYSKIYYMNIWLSYKAQDSDLYTGYSYEFYSRDELKNDTERHTYDMKFKKDSIAHLESNYTRYILTNKQWGKTTAEPTS